jgi:hypothetical protein
MQGKFFSNWIVTNQDFCSNPRWLRARIRLPQVLGNLEPINCRPLINFFISSLPNPRHLPLLSVALLQPSLCSTDPTSSSVGSRRTCFTWPWSQRTTIVSPRSCRRMSEEPCNHVLPPLIAANQEAPRWIPHIEQISCIRTTGRMEPYSSWRLPPVSFAHGSTARSCAPPPTADEP